MHPSNSPNTTNPYFPLVLVSPTILLKAKINVPLVFSNDFQRRNGFWPFLIF
jgi:hypothetical protein